LKPVELSAVGTDNAYARTPVDSPPRALTGDVSLAYLIAASNTKLRTHTGNAYRAPALYERYGGGFSTSPTTNVIVFTAYGDPRLEPDRYRTFDAGIDQRWWSDRVSASVTFFYIDVRSLIAFDSSGQITPVTDPFGRSLGYLNGSGGFSRGLELSADVRPASSVRLAASYTHTRAETENDVTVPGFFLVPAVFEHTATFVMTNRWTERVDSTVDLFYGGESYGAFSAAGRPRAYRYPSFTKAAVIARVRLSPGVDRAVRGYVKVDNLFDSTYYQGGWQGLGRTALAGVSVGF
jgi:outer membrane receptor for ferrienterochelin and colicin